MTGSTLTVRAASKLQAPSTNCVRTPNFLTTQKTLWSRSSNILLTLTQRNNCVDQEFCCFLDYNHVGIRHAFRTTFSAPRGSDRRGQCFGKDRGWTIRGDRQDRRGKRSSHLRRFLRSPLEELGGKTVQIRHHTAAAVFLYDRKECFRHHAGHRCNGPAAQRPVRRILSCFVGQRFYPPRRPYPRARRRCLRVWLPENPGELSAGLSKIRLHRESAPRRDEQQQGCRANGGAAPARQRGCPPHKDSDWTEGEHGRL